MGAPTLVKYVSVVLASLLLAHVGACPCAANEAAAAAFEVVSASPDARYDPLLVPRTRGWLGADGASSVRLGPEKVLWLFGDTILGTKAASGKRNGSIVRNTIGIQNLAFSSPDRVEYFWDLTDGIPGSFFLTEAFDQEFWYWPLSGALVDGQLYVFLYRVLQGEGVGGLDFKTGGMSLARIPNPGDPPRQWEKHYTDFDIGDDHRSFCSAVFVEEPYFYLFGHDDGPSREPLKRRMVAARVKIQDLRDGKGAETFEFWVEGETGGRWGREPANLVPLFEPGVTESSIQYNAEWGRYFCVTHYPFQSGVYLVSAPELTGPWSRPFQVYTVPEMALNKDYHAYAMKSHPELASSPDELVITYVVNTTDFWSLFTDPHIYYPRFVRVKLRCEAR